ncbi:MAG: DUF368 domain-containing protein, partial [Marinirhabdus sp.]|nr:DUF368 domain-containing protein [Marinirhabdus sp.]
LGNYVLLLVDSVNALYDTFYELIRGDTSFVSNTERLQMLKILAIFTLGSVAGMVSLSHLLAYVLDRFKKATYAVIIGFIAGSLGVVWPWKRKEYEMDTLGNIKMDANGEAIIKNYDRYWPSEFSFETFLAIVFIFVGITIVLSLDIYQRKKQPQTNG